MLQIDLNCDMGEGMSTDAAIMPFISSVNIACGGHAGDADTMRRTIESALGYQIAIGDHPSYPDRENFGRIDMLDPEARFLSRQSGKLRIGLNDLPGILTDQIGRLQKVCGEFGIRLHHIKPHGALYNRAAKDAAVSDRICRAIREIDPALSLYGLSGSEMKRQAAHYGLHFVNEAFADRTYREDGSLTPRTEPGALIDNAGLAVRQVLKMIRDRQVVASTGKEIPLTAETICIHGDGSHAVEFASMIHQTLSKEGIAIFIPVSF
jgi:UPF0271 protein